MNFKIKISIVSFILLCTSIFSQTDYNSESKQTELGNGLSFKMEKEYRIEDSTYTDTIQLINLTGKVQALQFRILINKADDDSTILIVNSIQRGPDLNDPSWLLEQNLIKGSPNSIGASKDEILVLLYNTNLNGGLIPGSYHSLFEINYTVIDTPSAKNKIKSSLRISNAEASMSNGNPIDIKSEQDELKIFVMSK